MLQMSYFCGGYCVKLTKWVFKPMKLWMFWKGPPRSVVCILSYVIRLTFPLFFKLLKKALPNLIKFSSLFIQRYLSNSTYKLHEKILSIEFERTGSIIPFTAIYMAIESIWFHTKQLRYMGSNNNWPNNILQ